MTRTTILAQWLAKVLVDRADIINKSASPVAIYAELYSEFMKDVQPAIKELLEVALPEIKRKKKK